ncbi:MAG: PQQ-dependent sugar dehydrogenase [Anaerolineae bacterium]|nr:PQQ-dependent sugar dehydrogenase [Anaerolineae bacterium]
MNKLLFAVVSILLICVPGAALLAQPADDNPAYIIEEVIEQPMITSIVWASDGRMFWTEKDDGRVRMMNTDGTIQEEPVIQVEVLTDNEQGLLSMALDPAFDENGFFYVFYTAPASVANPLASNLVVRYTLQDGVGINPLTLLQIDLPDNDLAMHNGGRLRFGPDDKFLYVAVGDLGAAHVSQDINNIGGKIHRFIIANNQLLPAPGNPFIGNSVFAYGVRNTFSFVFDPENSSVLYGTENGPDCDDEINRIVMGGNYGWTQDVKCDDPIGIRQAGGLPPLISWTPTVAPTGIMFYTGEAFPGWQGQLFYCTWKENELRRARLNEDHTAFDGEPKLVSAPYGQHCQIELAQGPDGFIYITNIFGMYRLRPPVG